jgi:heparan-alpha-glucosaminide N-acetyltransferase
LSTLLAEPLSTRDGNPNASPRIASIDIFRGLTMMVMIFVNDLDSVKGLPWWTYHMPAKDDFMTYVDMVFPAFLFIVGMAIPLATARRLQKDPSLPRLWQHILLRSASLVVLGLVLANADYIDRAKTGLSGDTWALLALIGAILLWNVYGKSERHRILFRVLKYSGFALLVLMLALFRRTTPNGGTAWLDISYWEILGLIGWTYLAVMILYVPTRRSKWAPLGWFLVLAALNAISLAGWIHFTRTTPFYLWPFGTGGFGMITMAGVVTSTIFFREERFQHFQQKAMAALVFSAVLLLSGWLLSPLGISKIRETPTWCLWCAGSSVLIFTALYWICDVKRRTAWALFVRPAGANTLLTYLLPDLFYFAFGTSYLASHFHHGWPGVLKVVVFTAFMLLLAAIFTRLRIRLQL